jgi:putative PIG3 family NAD(P)H quinone oxidoreductase
MPPNTVPKSMLAIRAEKGPSGAQLHAVEIPTPEPKPGEVLFKVAGAGVNRADLLQVQGHHPPPPGAPETPGLEASGAVVAVGEGVSGFRAGDAVCALLPGGGYAEYAIATEANLLPIPKGVSPRDAGGLPEVYFTVWSNVFDTVRLKPGETFLVHGGSSGIGTAAIQLMAARGHRVFTTAGSPGKCGACEALGAERAINYNTEDFVQVVKDATKGKGVDVILDMVGGDYVMKNLNALSRCGRLVNIAYQKGAKVEVDFRLVQARLLTLGATGLRGRPDAEKRPIRDQLLKEVWPLIAAGKIKPVTYKVFPLADAQAAHQLMRDSSHIGKILLEPGAAKG